MLGLDVEEWEAYAEDKSLYLKRAGGLVLEENKIIEDITRLLPMQVSPLQQKELLRVLMKEADWYITDISELPGIVSRG